MSAPEKKFGPDRELWKSIARETCFRADGEKWMAYQIARDGISVPQDCLSPRVLRLLADARENKPRPEPSLIRQRILQGYNAAALRSAYSDSKGRGLNFGRLEAGPTSFEVKCAFIRLFVPRAEWPKDGSRKAIKDFTHAILPPRQTVETVLDECKLPRRPDSKGRPRKSPPISPRKNAY